jgi:hypothetical protein
MDFRSQLNNAKEKIIQDAQRRQTRVALAAFQGINEGSPVDQGTFRANWNISFGELNRDFDLKLTDNDWAKNTSVAMMSILTEAKLGTTIYISNSVPYAIRLENGYSPQAKHGVVAPVFRKLQNAIESGKKL